MAASRSARAFSSEVRVEKSPADWTVYGTTAKNNGFNPEWGGEKNMATRILIIEDNQANLKLMVFLLKSFGYTPLAATDGEEGLEIARREVPDLIICDVQLPKLDGYEVARQLKSHPTLHAIPLIAVTALAMVGDRDRVMAAGFNGYISKPIKPRTFVEEVEAFLRADQRSTSPPTAQTAQAVQPARAPVPSTGATILVVDNVPSNLNLARSLFEPSGYQVLTAAEVEEALALARQALPDLILSDVNLSGGTGYELIAAVKADPQLSQIPFVFITSTASGSRDRAQCLALGADRFIVRPIKPQALLAKIEALLQERKEE
jgi:two-component system cell cycle response regulator